MTDPQKHQALNSIISATETQLKKAQQEISVLAAHLDLMRNVNNAPIDPVLLPQGADKELEV